jgi:lysophospholipase L1-like esterase
MSDNSFTLNDNDWVYIHTGINDITGYNTDATLYPVLTTYNSNLLALINNIKAYNANLKIGVLMTIAPCYYQEAFGDNYNNGLTQKRYARNRYLLNESILSYLNSNSFTNVYALPYHINLDTINNFTQELSTPNIRNVSSVMKYNDGLHPTRYGYYQLADVLKSNIKGFES